MTYNLKLHIWRGDASGGGLVDFTVPVDEGEVVLDAVHHVQALEAGDLAVRWNCKAGKCGSCSAEINGMPRLLCMTRLSELDPAQLAWLARDLAAHRETPTIVFVHHHPWPLGHAWMDTMTLRNGGQCPVTVTGYDVSGSSVTHGGLGGPRTNMMYYSTDGGATWASVTMGSSFSGPGVSACGYFAAMFPSYWRHMGWGDVGAGPSGIIHYAFAKHGAGSDPGDIYYTRSTDNGATWSTPIRIDNDSGSRAQWEPSLATSPDGHVFISWYDQRATTGTSYERWGRVSTDNGATWNNEEVISDVVSPLPAQPDPGIQAPGARLAQDRPGDRPLAVQQDRWPG